MVARDRYGQMSAERIEEVAETIVGRIPDCGSRQAAEQPYDEENPGEGEDSRISTQQATVEQRERTLVFEALFQELFGSPGPGRKTPAPAPFSRVSLRLSAEERLLLKLCHRDGLSVAKSGEMLGLNRFQAHGKLRRLYARIRTEFERAGLQEEIRQLLDS